MKQTIDFANLLFATTSKLEEFSAKNGDEIHIGLSGPNNVGLSKARSVNGTSSRSNRRAKINTFAYLCERLFSGTIAAAEVGADKIFVEYETRTGDKVAATFDGMTISFDGTIPADIEDISIPLSVYGLSSVCPHTDETKAAFETLKANLNGNTPWLESLYLCCDAFYFENNRVMPKSIEVDDDLLPESIAEAARTGGAEPIDLFANGATYPRTAQCTILEALDPDATVATAANPKKNAQSFFSSIKNGDLILNTYWDPARRSYIPDLKILDSFVPSSKFFKLVSRIKDDLGRVLDRMDAGLYGDDAICDDYVNIQMVGRPGTGKTTIANALAATFGMPIRVVAASKHTEEDTFTGMTKVQEGGFQFVETPFIDAFKNGGIIVLEEYNLADPGVMMGALGQAIERPFILLEDGYREVKRHPLCIVIATMNSGTMGSREPSEALTSRLPFSVMLEDPDEDAFLKILQLHTGSTENDCRKVYGMYKRVLDYLNDPSINEKQVALSITLRHCIEALKQMKTTYPFIEGGSNGAKAAERLFQESIHDSIIGAIAIKDRELADDVFTSVVKSGKSSK